MAACELAAAAGGTLGGDDEGVRAPAVADAGAVEEEEAEEEAVVLLTGSDGTLLECIRRGAGCPGRPPSPLLRELLLPDVASATGVFAAGGCGGEGAPIEAKTDMKPPADSPAAAGALAVDDASPFDETKAAATTGLAALVEFDADADA